MTAGRAAPDTSIVIVNWNAREEVVACLESIRSDPPATPHEVLVVDNASSDGSVEAIHEAAPWAHVIANATNRMLAAANNQGIAASRGRYVLLSNPDVRFRPGAIDELRATLDRHPSAAFAVPRLVNPDGSLQVGAGDLPTLREALLGRRFAGRRSRFWWHDWAHDEERAIPHGSEAAYLVRRDALADVGPQDERFPLDWEGIDWSARVGAAGWEIWFSPAAEVEHIGGVSLRQAQLRWIVSSHLGLYRYFARRLAPPVRLLLAISVAMRCAAKLAMSVVGAPLYERAHRRQTVHRGRTR